MGESDVSACVWMRYVSITFLELNIVDRSILQVKKTINGDPSVKLIFLYSPGILLGRSLPLTDSGATRLRIIQRDRGRRRLY